MQGVCRDTLPGGKVSLTTKGWLWNQGGFTGFTVCAQSSAMGQNASVQPGLGGIYAALGACSMRPRYAFLVLELIAEAAGADGVAGPFVRTPAGAVTLRDWINSQLMPLCQRNIRRAALRTRLVEALGPQLTGDPRHDEPLIADEFEKHLATIGRANVSRAVSDLVKAGLVRRHYAGYCTDHINRGGRRHAVYVLEAATLAALRRTHLAPVAPTAPRQGDLFAA